MICPHKASLVAMWQATASTSDPIFNSASPILWYCTAPTTSTANQHTCDAYDCAQTPFSSPRCSNMSLHQFEMTSVAQVFETVHAVSAVASCLTLFISTITSALPR